MLLLSCDFTDQEEKMNKINWTTGPGNSFDPASLLDNKQNDNDKDICLKTSSMKHDAWHMISAGEFLFEEYYTFPKGAKSHRCVTFSYLCLKSVSDRTIFIYEGPVMCS